MRRKMRRMKMRRILDRPNALAMMPVHRVLPQFGLQVAVKSTMGLMLQTL
jgi:hypothetical protein